MSPTLIMAMVAGCAIRDRRGDWAPAFDRMVTSSHPVTDALRELHAAGFDFDACISLVEEFERLSAEHADERAGPVAQLHRPPAPARATRTKLYGPAQDPDGYLSTEKLRAYNFAAAFVLGEPVERLPEREWWPLVGAVYRRDNFTCTYCGADGEQYALHCDHIVPVSRGGPNLIANLTTACDYCNCSKRDALPHEWRPLRGEEQ